MARRKLIALTGPSSFTGECKELIEQYFQANYVVIDHDDPENIMAWVGKVDGVILAGGVDIHPSTYKSNVWNEVNFSKFDRKRDVRELMIADAALQAGKPVLGICRGHQLMGVLLGLPLVADISRSTVCHQPGKQQITAQPDEPMHEIEFHDPAYVAAHYKFPRVAPSHEVIRRILKQGDDKSVWVNSFHHQAIPFNEKRNYAQHGVRVLGTARIDYEKIKKIVEIMEGIDKRWMSVQFHPEYDWRVNSASQAVVERFGRMLAEAK